MMKPGGIDLENMIVKTKQGLLQGKLEDEINVWRGIRYAEPPVGDLRLQPPQPPISWEGVKEAFEFGAICPQINEESELSISQPSIQSEDCLHLNIWTPITSEKALPVMVWIHGGAFRTGAGSLPFYDGARLSKRGQVIVVTINYRLGAFGFLHLNGLDDHYSANLGLLDQIAALEWVKENIEAFGGDPNKVTVFGESAGSMSIAALMSMPKAKGLFQQAIMESGASSALSPELATKIASTFIVELGGSPSDLTILKSATTEAYLQAAKRVEEKYGPYAGMLFQPTVDSVTLPKVPEQAIAEGAAEEIALLIGTNHDEGHYFFRADGPPMSYDNMVKALAGFVGLENVTKLIEFYSPTIDGQAQMMTDFVFWKPAITFAENQSKHSPVWMYRFDWCVEDHHVFGKSIHALEIPFVFNNLEFFHALKVPVNESMTGLAANMQDAWLTFVRYGKPEITGVNWDQYEPKQRATLLFNTDIKIVNDPYREKRQAIFGVQ